MALERAVDAFAAGAPQRDDMTAVLVKRERAAAESSRSFARSFQALPAIFEFTSGEFARQGIDARLLATVDLAVEELFTNMVKYSQGTEARVRIGVTRIAGGVEVTLTDYDVEAFDVTKAPDVDVSLPIEERRPGGLGLHLIRRLMDSVDYEYSQASRESRITLRKTLAGSVARRQALGEQCSRSIKALMGL